MMTGSRLAVLWGLFLAIWLGAVSAEQAEDQSALAKALASLSGKRMLADITRLSAPDFNGRQTGTADDLRSGLFVAERFQSLGLQAAGSQPLSATPAGPPNPQAALSQPWMITESITTTRISDNPQLELFTGSTTVSAHPGADYLPILNSTPVNVTALVVFVGYGISDQASGFDEYAGLDVKNRIVLFLRGKPEKYPAQVTHADKERAARDKGAIAFLTVTGPVMNAYESRRGMGTGPLAYYGQSSGSGDSRPSLPGAWISPALADRILSQQGPTKEGLLRETQEQLNRTLSPKSISTGVSAHLKWDSKQSSGTLMNVLGVMPDRDSSAQPDVVLIGAHRDHFGRQAGLLFPGADDNASGTAILLEVARALVQSGVRTKRAILFASFSGEEQGLLGSKLYVRQPARLLSNTTAMINVDHAGIGNGRLTVGVVGLPKIVATQAGQLAGLADKLDLFGFFPGGDHVPFKEAGIPTIAIVSAGAHPYFHQPTDTAETVQPEILQIVARYVLALTWHLANEP
ncbi:MAG TPA: M28 family peptidase [Nitrospiraceae bacterium]|nr:M28 family peptidase [Nitrospiraceae bacterium]